jgi:hypothetical protein
MDDFANFPRGCLPRKTLLCSRFKRAEEQIGELSDEELAELGPQVSLRPYVKTILSQNPAGSCACESLTGVVMATRAFLGLPHVELNPWFIYYHTGGKSDRGDGRSGGSSIDENLAFAMEYGIAPISVWPRSKGWGYRSEKPSAEAYAAALEFRPKEVFDITTVRGAMSANAKAFGVVYGAKGHSVGKIAYTKDRKGLDVNSWGTDWGDGGFGVWTPYSGIDWRYGAYALRVV